MSIRIQSHFWQGSPELQIVGTMKIQFRALLTWAQEGKVTQTTDKQWLRTVFFRPPVYTFVPVPFTDGREPTQLPKLYVPFEILLDLQSADT